MFRDRNQSIIISYLALRRLIGILGILLPFICVLGGFIFANLCFQESISYYYHTNMRDFFVGLLISVSMFLITYKGYEKIDFIITTITGIFGLGIPFFPCLYNKTSIEPVGIFQINPALSDKIHLTCASIFFILLAINSMFLFTLSKKDVPKTKNKIIRNRIYVACGVVILLSLLALLILMLVMGYEEVKETSLILLLETIMLIAFGISWLIKGKTLFKDEA